MLKILSSYGIPPEIAAAIKVMYENTSALVITPEGNTDIFKIDAGVLQGDPLAPFFFHCLSRLCPLHFDWYI